MKKYTAIVFAVLLCFLCACSMKEKGEINCEYPVPLEFSSVEELIDYLGAGEGQTAQNVLNYSTSSVKNIEVPNESAFKSAFDAELAGATLSGNYVNYLFVVNNVDISQIRENYRLHSDLFSNTADAEEGAEKGDTDDERQMMMDEFVSFSREITITCNVKAEGGNPLVDFASGNPVEYWEEHPGFYYTRAPYIDMDEPYGYMIYWEDFDNFFSAYVPASLVDSFFENYDSLIETVTIEGSSNLETE